MIIPTQQDMLAFCGEVKEPFSIEVYTSNFNLDWLGKNREMIQKGKIGKGSHLQQGIKQISYSPEKSQINLTEVPYLYPSGKILEENPDLTGPMTGVLVNCCDRETQEFLFHMRGTNISVPFGFQAAAAGMGVYGQHPSVTAALELQQEAGLENFRQVPRNGVAFDILPFMKAGKIPQPLFSFGFFDDLSEFPVCASLEDIAEFELKIKKGLNEKTIQPKEAYHFTIPYGQVERIAGELNDKKRFYGPIYDSTMNFIRTLKDAGTLD